MNRRHFLASVGAAALTAAADAQLVGPRRTAVLSKSLTFYDSDAAAYFATMTVQWPADWKAAGNALIVGLKADGLWTKISMLCAGHALTPQQALLDMKGGAAATMSATPVTHTPGVGMRGNGTSSYVDTGRKVSAQNDNTLFCSVRSKIPYTATPANSVIIGNTNCGLTLRNDDSLFFSSNTSGVQKSEFTGIGLHAVTRLSPTLQSLYVNASLIGTDATASAAVDSVYTVWVGAKNRATPAYGAELFSWYGLAAGLIATEITALNARLKAFDDAVQYKPSNRNATAETAAMLKYLHGRKAGSDYVLGCMDYFGRGFLTTPPTPATGDWDAVPARYVTMCGKQPGIFSTDYEPLDGGSVTATSTGAVSTAAQRQALQVQRIKEMYAAGMIIELHDHPSNPVSSSGSFAGTDYTTRNNLPVDACLAGGPQRANFLTYVDGISTFLNLLVDGGGKKIPVIMRWFHEQDTTFAWWTGDDRSLSLRQLHRDFIDRLRANGINHTIHAISWQAYDSTSYIHFYPGDDYCDIVTIDFYDDTAGGTPLTVTSTTPAAAYTRFANVFHNKPFAYAEVGYLNYSKTWGWDTMVNTPVKTQPRVVYVGYWTQGWGPEVNNTNLASLVTQVNDPACITLDKMVGVYGP